MDSLQREELERLMFFEQTREKAAADYIRSPTDPDVRDFLALSCRGAILGFIGFMSRVISFLFYVFLEILRSLAGSGKFFPFLSFFCFYYIEDLRNVQIRLKYVSLGLPC